MKRLAYGTVLASFAAFVWFCAWGVESQGVNGSVHQGTHELLTLVAPFAFVAGIVGSILLLAKLLDALEMWQVRQDLRRTNDPRLRSKPRLPGHQFTIREMFGLTLICAIAFAIFPYFARLFQLTLGRMRTEEVILIAAGLLVVLLGTYVIRQTSGRD